MKVGLIFECGREGADIQVCCHLLSKLDPNVEYVSQTMDNKSNLIDNCGPVAAMLLKKCDRVIIIWDLFPAWREKGIKPCRREDRQSIFTSLRANSVPKSKVSLVCIKEELEAWLLADNRAVKNVLSRYKAPHPVGRVSEFKKPEQIKNPKMRLTKYFNKELGSSRRYEDLRDAVLIAKEIRDFNKLRRSGTFRRFALKATGVRL